MLVGGVREVFHGEWEPLQKLPTHSRRGRERVRGELGDSPEVQEWSVRTLQLQWVPKDLESQFVVTPVFCLGHVPFSKVLDQSGQGTLKDEQLEST